MSFSTAEKILGRLFGRLKLRFSAFWLMQVVLGWRVTSRRRQAWTRTRSFFSTTRQTVVKTAVLKPLEVCFALWSSSSIHFNLNLLFTVKRNCSIFIHDLERANEFLRLNSHVKFSSNKVEVAWRFICHVKYWSVTEIVSCILLKSNQMIFLVRFGINKHS